MTPRLVCWIFTTVYRSSIPVYLTFQLGLLLAINHLFKCSTRSSTFCVFSFDSCPLRPRLPPPSCVQYLLSVFGWIRFLPSFLSVKEITPSVIASSIHPSKSFTFIIVYFSRNLYFTRSLAHLCHDPCVFSTIVPISTILLFRHLWSSKGISNP